ncbi:hypothetical protein ACJJTC_002374 [Scirpophaga incertulas]
MSQTPGRPTPAKPGGRTAPGKQEPARTSPGTRPGFFNYKKYRFLYLFNTCNFISIPRYIETLNIAQKYRYIEKIISIYRCIDIFSTSLRPGTTKTTSVASTPTARKTTTPIPRSIQAGPAPRRSTEAQVPTEEAPKDIPQGTPFDVKVIIHTPQETQGPRLPAFYAEKAKSGIPYQPESRDPKLTKQRSFETISRSRTPFGSQETLLSQSFDHGARTPSPSQFHAKAPSPFRGRSQQQGLETIEPLPPREAQTFKRKFDHDASAPTQPQRGPASRKNRRGKKGRRKQTIHEAEHRASEIQHSTEPRKAPQPRHTQEVSADTHIEEPSAAPVVAASTRRTKAKQDAAEQAPTSAGQTSALEDLISLVKELFVSAMKGESLTTLISRGLTELWQLLSKTWTQH